MRIAIRVVPALFLLALCTAVPASAQSFPASWEGLWEFTNVMEDCEGTPMGTEIDTSSICEGDVLTPDDEGFTFECTGTIDDDSIDLVCTAGEEVSEDCTASLSYTLEGIRTGDTVTGIQTTTITYTGAGCGPIENICLATEITGTRISPEPENCITPVQPATWGAIKARYK